MKKIFIIFLFTFILQAFGDCNNCNKITVMTSPTPMGFQKPQNQKPKTHPNTTHSNLRPKPNTQKPNLVPTHIQNAISTTNVFGSTDNALLVTTTSSGNTIVIGTTTSTGSSTSTNGTGKNLAIASYSSNGSLNRSFGTNGISVIDLVNQISGGKTIGSSSTPVTFGIQSNGLMIVAGNTTANALNLGLSSTSAFFLARYKTDGSLDTSFGINGVVCTNLFQNTTTTIASTDTLVAISLQTNGRILAAGNSTAISGGSSSSFAVARYTPTGNLDTSFNSGGSNVVNVAATLSNSSPLQLSSDYVTSMSVLSNGKIVLCGYSNYLSPNFQFTAMRFMSNGTLDTSFGTSGIVLTNVQATLNPT